jgi:hypothetical protein
MCNPRRITVRASRDLSQAWTAEITRQAQVSETLRGQARITEPFATGLARPVRQRFEELLHLDEGWREQNGTLRYDTPNGYLVYHPDTGELELVAEVQAEIRAEAEATRRQAGTTTATAEAEVEISYYRDGYGGKTRKWARQQGETQAGTAAEAQAQADLEQLSRDEQAQAEAELESQAQELEAEAYERARLRLGEDRRTQQEHLDTEAAEGVQNLRTEFLEVVGRPLAHAYRDVLLARAEALDAENLHYSEQDGVIQIQFEMEG